MDDYTRDSDGRFYDLVEVLSGWTSLTVIFPGNLWRLRTWDFNCDLEISSRVYSAMADSL